MPRAVGNQAFRGVRRLPNDSMVVAFLAGALVADVVRARAAAAFFAGDFFAAAFVAGAFFGGAFLAAAAFAVGLRVGVAVVAEVSFFRATRVVVGVGFSPGVLAALAPVARFVAAATFFAATFRLGGIVFVFAPVALRVLPAAILTPPLISPAPPDNGRARSARSSRASARQTRVGQPDVSDCPTRSEKLAQNPSTARPPTTGSRSSLSFGATRSSVPPSGSRVYSWSLEKTTTPIRCPAGKM